MASRFWIVEGWESTTQIWAQRIPLSLFSEMRMERLLQVLCAKHGLSEDEIVDALCRKNSRRFAPHLEIQRSSGPPFTLTCGSNPYFVARVEVQ
jgi:hypothetical protein